MSKKTTLIRVSEEAKTNLKTKASSEGKTLIKLIDEFADVSGDKNKNYKSIKWGKMF